MTKSALADVAKAAAQLADARKSLQAIRARRRITCSCGRRHAIGDLHLLVTHWYVEPHGCTGGDYWKEGEWQFVCPKTQVRNRLMFNDYDVDWKERDTVGIAAEPTFKRTYDGLFKSKEKTYDKDQDPRPTFNNHDVDNRRKYFELPPKKPKTP